MQNATYFLLPIEQLHEASIFIRTIFLCLVDIQRTIVLVRQEVQSDPPINESHIKRVLRDRCSQIAHHRQWHLS